MNFLFKLIDNASLIFIRVVFGLLAFADIIGIFSYYHLYTDSFNPEKFQFKYYGFEWVQPMPEPFMSLFFIGMIVLTVFITIGKWYRPAMTTFFVGFTYIFFLEKAHYLNHAYLVMWLSFVFIFLPLNRNFSRDSLKNPNLQTNRAPYWCLFIIQFMMSVVYFYGGIAKINPDWIFHAQPLKIWLGQRGDMPLLGWIWRQEITAWMMSWGGFALDFFVVFFLLIKRTRIWAFCFVLFFHFVNLILFQIGIFPWMSLALTALFFEPDFPRKVNVFIISKWAKFGKIDEWWGRKIGRANLPPPTLSDTEESVLLTVKEKLQNEPFGSIKKWRLNRILVFAFLFPICLFHLTYPFRHHLLEGNVAWTEEGHRYSWRMMLRSKQGYGHFNVVDKKTGKQERISPSKYLSKKQKPKIYTHPDMILQFAHYLEQKYWEEEGREVEIYAEILAKLNGRKYQQYTNKNIDLTKEKWSFFEESMWIVPLKEEE
ncbi:MAG: vitamin K-dependent gamma-carboxylase [Paraglaciecola sp.]|jgi:vitamin K-dependent gamma-carboxylase